MPLHWWYYGSASHTAPTFEATAELTAAAQTLSGSATFAPGTKTATAALETSAQTLAASASHTAPTYAATAALAASAQTLAASGTFAEGAFTATAALESSSQTLAASATYDPGTFTATASLEASSQTLAASATHTAPEYSATASLTAGSQTLAASATFAAGTFTATAALTAASQTLAATATHTAPTFEATGALSASSQTLAASGTFATHTYSATADLGVSAQTLSASAAHTPPSFTATAALDASAQTLAASATFGAGTHTATADLTATSQTLAASATHTPPEYSATAALESSSQTLAALGATGDVFLATAALEASSQTLSATGQVHYKAQAALTASSQTLAAAGQVYYKATAALVASSQILAAAVEAPIVWHADTLRLYDGLTEIRHLAAIGTIPGVVPAHAAACNGPGTARIRYTAAGNLQYRAPGSSTYGAAFPADPLPTNIAALATPSFVLRDGEDTDKWLRVEVYSDYLPTVATEAEIELADVLANAVSGDHCAAADALAGEVITQEITCTNVGSIVGTDSDITALKFWLTAPTGVTLEISDDGSTWVSPTTEGAALVLGTVAADASVTLHVRRTIAAASGSAASLLAQLHASFTYRGESYRLDARGRFHVFNAAGYHLHWTTDPADPPAEGATPDATVTSLPATPADTFADGTYYLAAARFNGVFASGFYPVGSSGEQYLRLEIVGGAEVGNPPPGPAEVRLEVLASGVVRVHAWLVADPTDTDNPEAWAIGYTTTGLDPTEDTPDATETLTASGLIVLQYDLPAQAHGTEVKVRIQTRRNDGTTDTPSWVYSDGSVVYTATADANGPTEALALVAGY